MAGLLDFFFGNVPQNAVPGFAGGYVDPVTGQTFTPKQISDAANVAVPEMMNGLPAQRAGAAAGMPVNDNARAKAPPTQPASGNAPPGGLLNRMGDALISMGNPYADPAGMTDPRARQIAIGQTLMNLGAGIGGARTRNPLEAVTQGLQHATQAGQASGNAALEREYRLAQIDNAKSTAAERRAKAEQSQRVAAMFGIGGAGGAAPAMPASASLYGPQAGAPAFGGTQDAPAGGAPMAGGGILDSIPPEFRQAASIYAAGGDYEKALALATGAADPNKPVRWNAQTGRYEPNPVYIQARSQIAAAGRPNIDTKVTIAAETEGAKQAAKDAAEAYKDIQTGARNAAVKQAYMKQMDALLDQVDTGKFAGTVADVKALGKRLGVDLEKLGIRDDVGPAEAARALSNQMALQMRSTGEGAGMPGAMSDKDREFLVQMVPGLETTPQGRKLMAKFYGRVNDYNRGLAKAVQDYVKSKGGVPDYGIHEVAQRYAESNPIFSQADIDAAMAARAASASPAPAPLPTGGPAPGTVINGYRYKGGNPNDRNSWEPAR